ncbi:GNAT family N-acetyltransferase [Occallatibacter savannae]|uniref:GNAT family N-acetyltransferase n=1 Tax=Occallatibacter savannae TaxID=1002691 RepID=UPI000D694948|nr:GNAT family N-acetyltransferase [Occallatibacter savannae]
MRLPNLHIRLATPADRPSLVPLINAAFAIETFLEGTRTDDDRLSAMMQQGEILLAEDASHHPLACIYAETRGPRGYLGQLAVDPAHQRSGLGKQLLAAAEDHFRARGCEAIDITVLSLRPELLPIYRRLGFVETGTEEFHMARAVKDGQHCHCIKMSKPL